MSLAPLALINRLPVNVGALARIIAPEPVTPLDRSEAAAVAPTVSRPWASKVTFVYVPAVPVFFKVVASEPPGVVISPVRAGKLVGPITPRVMFGFAPPEEESGNDAVTLATGPPEGMFCDRLINQLSQIGLKADFPDFGSTIRSSAYVGGGWNVLTASRYPVEALPPEVETLCWKCV